MDLISAAELAWELLAEYQLHDWSFGFDRARRRAGATNFSKRKITLSRELTTAYSETQVREIILHEIAHALVGAAHGHNQIWRAKCIEIGAKPIAYLREDATNEIHNAARPKPLWIGTCPAKHKIDRYRRPRTPQSCARCSRTFSPKHLISWRNTRTGEVIS
ncbi:SprT-like domain-containing protein [Arcanobacterium hippocoleae]|uniref:SprT family Zn-dependent metalloprotease n=1 Tax=Arcanobacterium hippocoleae TaxID=149017 RepID=A0ABU1T2B0_9ACTO|nr:SprT-like domain-containing protein [Arcanobacterium hippocoleae]MDR6939517.1 putative SprT family Zn-dependent metalloprotease [Arcanobacterium hippocoleae]